jgi:hypothetical protein
VGAQDVVFAADTQGYDGDSGGYYKFKYGKLFAVNNGKYLLGVAGHDIGLTLEESVRDFHFTGGNDCEIFQSIRSYSEAMAVFYEQSGYEEDCYFILGGVNRESEPFLFEWHVKGKNWQLSKRVNQPRIAIGAKYHGALYFSTIHHEPNLPLPNRVLIAHLSVSEAAKQDPRVADPVEIGIVSKSGALILSHEQIAPIVTASREVAAQISATINNEAIKLQATLELSIHDPLNPPPSQE